MSEAKRDLLARFPKEHSIFVELGHALGPEVLDTVLRIFDGVGVTPPKAENFWRGLERELRNERICAEFNGGNYPELATRHGLTVRQVRNIVEAQREAKKGTAAPGNGKGSRL